MHRVQMLSGDVVEMTQLLDAEAEPDALVAGRDANGTVVQCTALLAAAERGQLDAVRLLLDRGTDPSLGDSNGITPLMAAAMRGHAGVVRELAARGADLEVGIPKNGATAFHLTCLKNQPECVAALVELGCDTAIKAKSGHTGKEFAEQRGHAAVLDVLRAAVAARLRAGTAVDQPVAAAIGAGAAMADALYTVSQAGDVVEMARLLDAGAEPDALVAAAISAVSPLLSARLGSAPRSSSSRTASSWPRWAAWTSAVV